MTDFQALLVSLTLYKVTALLSGTVLAYMGYRLFMARTRHRRSDLLASLGKLRFAIQSAAPGTFFSVLGAATVILAVFRGMDVARIAPWPRTTTLISQDTIDMWSRSTPERRAPYYKAADKALEEYGWGDDETTRELMAIYLSELLTGRGG